MNDFRAQSVYNIKKVLNNIFYFTISLTLILFINMAMSMTVLAVTLIEIILLPITFPISYIINKNIMLMFWREHHDKAIVDYPVLSRATDFFIEKII
jgi:hypothetical protein